MVLVARPTMEPEPRHFAYIFSRDKKPLPRSPMSRLALTSELLVELRKELLKSADESCGILFGRPVVKNGRLARIVVRDVQWMTNDDYLERTNTVARLRPEVVA